MNFTLEEFQKSNTAKRLGIDNSIPAEYMDNVKTLAKLMQLIRNMYMRPIVIDSGYRCKRLNDIVGGAKNSDHLYAAACDFRSVSDTLEDNIELWNIVMYMKGFSSFPFRQCIWEYGCKGVGPSWIHVSVNNNKNKKIDRQILYIGI